MRFIKEENRSELCFQLSNMIEDASEVRLIDAFVDKVAKKEIDKAILLYNEYRLHFSINLKTPEEVYNNPEVLESKSIPCI